MSPDLNVLPWILTVLSTSFLLILVRQKQTLQTLISDLHSRLEAGREGYELLSRELDQTVVHLQANRQSLADAEAALKDLKDRYVKKELQHQKDIQEQKDERQGLLLRLEHLEQESVTLKEQLAESDLELKNALDNERAHSQAHLQAGSQAAKQKQQQLQQQIADLKKESSQQQQSLAKQAAKVARLNEILKAVDPTETKKAKRKLKQMEQLYISIKGRKELTEERNANLEAAVRHLAAHLTGTPLEENAPLGQVLGRALNQIGVELGEADMEEGTMADDVATQEAINPQELVASVAANDQFAGEGGEGHLS